MTEPRKTKKRLPRPQHDERDRKSGRYIKSVPCDMCGKPVGTDHGTDDEVCGLGDGPGFYLCARVKCWNSHQSLSVEERRKAYTAGRARNRARQQSEKE